MIAIPQAKELHSIAALSRLVGMDRRTVSSRIKTLKLEPDAVVSGHPLYSTVKARIISNRLTPGAKKFAAHLREILRTPGESDALREFRQRARSIFDPNNKSTTPTSIT